MQNILTAVFVVVGVVVAAGMYLVYQHPGHPSTPIGTETFAPVRNSSKGSQPASSTVVVDSKISTAATSSKTSTPTHAATSLSAKKTKSPTNSDLPPGWEAASPTVTFSASTTQNFILPATIDVHPQETSISANRQYKITLRSLSDSDVDLIITAGTITKEVIVGGNPVDGPSRDTAKIGNLQVTYLGSAMGDTPETAMWTQVVLAVSKAQ